MKRSGWIAVGEILRKAKRGELLLRQGDISAVRSIIAGLTFTQRRYLRAQLSPHLTYEGVGVLFDAIVPPRRPAGAKA